MAGFDWRPRAMNPVSWHACDERYSRRGTPAELAEHIGRGVSWYRKHPGKNGVELVLIYAWNEFDEGGWLVPALPPPATGTVLASLPHASPQDLDDALGAAERAFRTWRH